MKTHYSFHSNLMACFLGFTMPGTLLAQLGPIIGSWPGPGGIATKVVVENHRAYVALDGTGFGIVDVSNPANPVTLGISGFNIAIRDIAVANSHIYVARKNLPSLFVMNASDPALPKLVNTLPLTSLALDLEVEGSRLYIAAGEEGLLVYDLSNLPSPARVGTYNTPGYACAVRVEGRYAYVADGNGGLLVLDVGQLPYKRMGSTRYDLFATAVDVAGQHAYVTDPRSGLVVVSIANRTTPYRVGEFAVPGASAVRVVGNSVWVFDGSGGVRVVDVTNPSHPACEDGVVGWGLAQGFDLEEGYVYLAEGDRGVTVAPARPGDNVPVILSRSGPASVFAGSEALFGVTAFPCPDRFQFQWYLNGSPLDGAIHSYYWIGAASDDDAGQYSVVVTGGGGSVTQSFAPLEVLGSPPAVRAYTGYELTNATVSAGQEVRIYAVVVGAPRPALQWWFKNQPLVGETGSVLTLTNVDLEHSGAYRVVASNTLGTAVSGDVTLTVVHIAPVVKASFQQGGTSATVGAESEVRLCAQAGGAPRPALQWQFNGQDLTGQTGACLVLDYVDLQHSGEYTVVASNKAGMAISPALTLSVIWLNPVLVRQPQDQTVVEGDTARFVVRQESAAPRPDYLLLFNGVPHPAPPIHEVLGEVRFVLPEVTLADAGQYSIICSNVSGVVTSEVVTLTVTSRGPLGPLDRWTQRNPRPSSARLRASARGPDTFVAVGDQGTILTSPDGMDWVTQRRLVDSILRGVAWGQGRFVVVGDGGLMLTSSNGVDWTGHSTRGPHSLTDVTFARGQFLAVGGSNSPVLLRSADGLSWSQQSLPITNPAGIAFSDDTYVIAGSGLCSSKDGLHWIPGLLPPVGYVAVTFGNGQFLALGASGFCVVSANGEDWQWWGTDTESQRSAAYGHGQYVIVGKHGAIRTSRDGQTWASMAAGTEWDLEDVVFAGDQFIAVGEKGAVLSSSDTVSWVPRTYVTTRNLFRTAMSGGTLVVAGNNGTILTTVDGVHYEVQASGTTADLRDVTRGGEVWMAAGGRGTVLTSPDAVHWTLGSVGFDVMINRVLFANGQWIAVGAAGALFTSTDAVTWTRRSVGGGFTLNDIAYGNGKFVIVAGGPFGLNGGLYVSADGISWTTLDPSKGQNLYSVTFADGVFLVAGAGGRVLISANGLDWETRSTGLTANIDSLRASMWSQGLWTVVGYRGIILTSTNTVDWIQRVSRTASDLFGVIDFHGRMMTFGTDGTVLQSARFRPAEPGGSSTMIALWQELLELRNASTRAQDVQQLDDGLDRWQKGLEVSLWSGDTTLDGRAGGQVFLELKHAIHALEGVLADKKSSVPRSDIEGFVRFLVGSARLLAVEELNIAMASRAGTLRIANALEALVRGDAQADRQQASSALEQYRLAWQLGGRLQGKLVIRPVSAGLALEYTGPSNQMCILECSADMRAWKPVGKARAGSDGMVQFVEPMVRGSLPCFYRVRLVH